MLPPGVILDRKIHQNAFAVGDLPRTPIGGVYSAFQASLTGFQGDASWQGSGEEERRGEDGRRLRDGRREREGEVSGKPPLLFLQFNHCIHVL